MKLCLRSILGVMLLLLPVHTTYAILRGRTFLSPRSQSTHAERELVGWQDKINLYVDDCVNYGCITAMPLYSRTIKPDHITEYFFGKECLQVSGSQVPDRGSDDLLADYFGLPLDYQSTLTFDPTVQNILVDLDWYAGLDAWYPGLYVRAHAPIVHTMWTMGLRETVINAGTQGAPAGYMAHQALVRGDMNHDMLEYFKGGKQVGDIEPLDYGKICGTRCHNGLSDIQVVCGWNFVNAWDHHFGFNLRTAIPTGNKSHARYFFEPIVGNGGRWELGFGLTGHTVMYESFSGADACALYGDMNVTHLFSSWQKRSFDFRKNRTLSRYMLIQDLGTPIVQGLQVGDQTVAQQYHGVLMPAINQTTLEASFGIALQVDLVIKFAYMHHGFSFDVGYNLWGRTAESFHCRERFPDNAYAVKGDAQVYGFHEVSGRFVALNATESEATIHAGQKGGNVEFANSNVDNSVDQATKDPLYATFELDDTSELVTTIGGSNFIRGSQPSILLTDKDIDNLSAAASAALSNSFFVHINHTWQRATALPFVGVGTEVSLDGGSKRRHGALSECAVWVKGGVAY
ncbi:MAG TPA: hypothetical protein VLG71_00390 [Candidatus Limnocylindria bacterium]|nr:hypothetical protein [Candidatus Limnocylindria bacterium]